MQHGDRAAKLKIARPRASSLGQSDQRLGKCTCTSSCDLDKRQAKAAPLVACHIAIGKCEVKIGYFRQ